MGKIKSLIKDLGFPIACCLILFYGSFKIIDNNTRALNDIRIELTRLSERINRAYPVTEFPSPVK